MTHRSPSGGGTRRWVARSAAANTLSRATALLTAFLLTPFILGHIGRDGFGLWVFVGAIVGYAALLDLGLAGAVTKYVAQHVARDEWDDARAVVATALRIYGLLGAGVLAVAALAAPIVPVAVGLPREAQDTAALLVFLLGAGVAVAIPAATASATLRGLGRYDVLAAVRIGGTLLAAAVTVVVLEAGGGVVGMAATNVPITLTTQLALVLAIRRVAPRLRFGPRGARRSTAREIASFSAPLIVLDVAGRLQSESDEVVIGTLLPLSAVTPFALAARVSGIARVATEQFSTVLLPLAATLEARGDRARLQESFVTGTRVTLAIFVPVGIGTTLLAGAFLSAWVGPDYAGAAPIVAVLTLAAGLDLVMWPAGFVLQGIRRHHRLALIALASGIANVALSVALAGPFGPLGVAIGTLVPTAAECLFLVMPYAFRVLGVDLRRGLREIAVPALAPSMPAILVVAGLDRVLDPDTFVEIAVVAGAGVLAYGLPYLAIAETRSERAALLDVVAALRARFARP